MPNLSDTWQPAVPFPRGSGPDLEAVTIHPMSAATLDALEKPIGTAEPQNVPVVLTRLARRRSNEGRASFIPGAVHTGGEVAVPRRVTRQAFGIEVIGKRPPDDALAAVTAAD